MNKKFKRSLGIALLVLIVGANVVKTPAILEPVLQLIGVILIGKVVIGLLKAKDKKETDGSRDHKSYSTTSIYDKIPTGVVLVAAVVVGILAIKFVAPTLTPFSVIGGIILGIFLCYRITKNVNKELEEDDDNIVEFRKPKK